MFKTFAVAMIVLVCSHALADEAAPVEAPVEVAAMEMPKMPETCTIQLIKALNIPDSAIPDMDLSWNFPTEEYTDGLVNFATDDRIVIATMRCFTDGRPMARVN